MHNETCRLLPNGNYFAVQRGLVKHRQTQRKRESCFCCEWPNEIVVFVVGLSELPIESSAFERLSKVTKQRKEGQNYLKKNWLLMLRFSCAPCRLGTIKNGSECVLCPSDVSVNAIDLKEIQRKKDRERERERLGLTTRKNHAFARSKSLLAECWRDKCDNERHLLHSLLV